LTNQNPKPGHKTNKQTGRKTNTHLLWPRINSVINKLIKTHGFVFFCGASFLFLRCQLRNFESMTLVARQRKHLRGFLVIFLVPELPPKEVFWYT